jgi:hypothetical protein
VIGVALQLHNLGFGAEWLLRLWPILVILFGARILYGASKAKNQEGR